MRHNSASSALALICLATCIDCHEPDGPMTASMDQSPGPRGDMATTAMPDGVPSDAPGMVRYTYTCGDKPEKTVELKHERFGPSYYCAVHSDNFFIQVKDDRVPVDFRLSIPNYHGPGSYTLIADAFIGTGFSECVWPSIQIADQNCIQLIRDFSPCCNTKETQARTLTCTVTVKEHTPTRVAGEFNCLVQSEVDGPSSPVYCPPSTMVPVHGSFDYGEQDCL